MKANNPFTLTFGKQPNTFISRPANAEAVTSTFLADNPVSQAYLIEGIRGSGKTVLMTAVSAQLSADKEWIRVDLNSTQDLLSDFAVKLISECKKKPSLLDRGFNLSVAGFGVGIGSAGMNAEARTTLTEILKTLKKKKKKVLITIDEVQHDQNMRAFASEFQIFLRNDYPVYLIMTGLFEQIYAIQNDPALTFLLRTPKISLEPLSIPQITYEYADIFRLEPDKALALAKLTKGYAFAFQALGMLYFEHRDELDLNRILQKLDALLDDYVYRKIWSDLTKREQEILHAMSKGKTTLKDICAELSMSTSTYSKYRDLLKKKGVLVVPAQGEIAFALPRFGEVIKYYD